METIDYDGLMRANVARVFSERDPVRGDWTRSANSMRLTRS